MAVYWDVNRYGFNEEHGGDKQDVLWQNASPVSGFLPQGFSFDLSKYRFVYIYARISGGGTVSSCIVVKPGVSVQFIVTTGTDIRYRDVIVSNTGVQFGDGHTSNPADVNNNVCIPQMIIGIK